MEQQIDGFFSLKSINKVFLGERGQERTGGTGAEERNTKTRSGHFLFPGFPHMVADGLCLED